MRGRFARGAVWSLIGAFLAQGSNVVASVITARLLGREQFGEYGMIQSTVGMLGILAGLGLGVTATKYVAEFRFLDPARAGRIIALGCATSVVAGGLLALCLAVWAPLLAARTLNAPPLAHELRIASVLLFFNALNGAQTGALAGFEAFPAIARINLVRGLVTLPVAACLAILWRLPGAVWALALTAGVTCFLSQLALRQQCSALGIHPQLSSAWKERRVLWTFSAPVFLSGAVVGPVTWAANAILVNQPGGYAEMAVFSAASQWRSGIGFVPGVLMQSALPLLSNLSARGDVLRYGKALRWNLILTGVAASGVALPVILGAPLIMQMYGPGFQHGWLVLVVLAATATISCMNGVVGTAIVSGGSVWAGLAFNCMWSAVFLTGCYCLIPMSHALGLAGSMLGAYLAHTAWQAMYLRRRLSCIDYVGSGSAVSAIST